MEQFSKKKGFEEEGSRWTRKNCRGGHGSVMGDQPEMPGMHSVSSALLGARNPRGSCAVSVSARPSQRELFHGARAYIPYYRECRSNSWCCSRRWLFGK